MKEAGLSLTSSPGENDAENGRARPGLHRSHPRAVAPVQILSNYRMGATRLP